jgi:6-phosphogluconolactonase (cycloisomerase 2 family)
MINIAKKTVLLLTLSLSIASAQSIYVATNKADTNTIMAYKMQNDGNFKTFGEFKTGGKGTGDLEVPALKKDPTHPLANGDDPLISAYGVTVTKDKKNLLVVNAGDATVSMFKINPDESLTLVNSVKIHDKFPLSVAESNGNVVVASVGSTNKEGSIEAMQIQNGKLVSVENSLRDLKARPSTVKFSTDGLYLILTELVTGKVKSYAFESGTLSKKPISVVDLPREDAKRFQAIPVGFDIQPSPNGDIVVVSEARFLTPDFKLRMEKGKVPQTPKYSWQTGSISTLMLDKNGMLKLVSKDVLTGDAMEGGEIANCWVEFSKDGSKLWAANALSSSISLFDIAKDGTAKLSKVTTYKRADELEFLSDMKLSESGDMLFQLVGNMGEVLVLTVNKDGDLKLKQRLGGLPKYGSYGLTSVSLQPMLKDTASLDKVWQGTAPTPMDKKFDIPLDERKLFAYLQSGAYKSWKHKEKAVHKSTGPHENVRAFINDTLANSLLQKNKEHPSGSIIVKEQYNAKGDSLGWAVMAKTQNSTDNGKGWFWYEVLSDKDISKKAAYGNGVPGCVGCHTPSPKDMVLIPFPFK